MRRIKKANGFILLAKDSPEKTKAATIQDVDAERPIEINVIGQKILCPRDCLSRKKPWVIPPVSEANAMAAKNNNHDLLVEVGQFSSFRTEKMKNTAMRVNAKSVSATSGSVTGHSLIDRHEKFISSKLLAVNVI